MNRGWVLFAASAALAALAVVATILSFGFPVAFPVALALAAGSYGCWSRAKERISENVYTRVGVEPNEDGTVGDEGARATRDATGRVEYEPRDDWDDPETWPFDDPFWSDTEWDGPREEEPKQQSSDPPEASSPGEPEFLAPREREACSVLGIEVGASPEERRTAYRERVKETHPDHGGDEDAFKRVQWAYDYLRRRRND